MSVLRALLNTERWMNPRLLPNQAGFKFRAKLTDGRQIDCELYRKKFNIRVSVRSVEKTDLQFSDIESWLGF